jgi:hypothetical protein
MATAEEMVTEGVKKGLPQAQPVVFGKFGRKAGKAQFVL